MSQPQNQAVRRERSLPQLDPTITVDHKTLKVDNDCSSSFAENEDLFNQMIRDFNLYNIWGIHVVGISYPGYQAYRTTCNPASLKLIW